MPEDEFVLMSIEEMRAIYGLTAENKTALCLNPNRVPKKLHVLIPLAEYFGVSDDLIRQDLLKRTPKRSLAKVLKQLAKYDDDLDDWLAGPEAAGPHFSVEYLAFSCLRMALDSC